jgi:hypothetical protein
MCRWIDEIFLLIAFERVVRRDRHKPITSEFISDAVRKSLELFPDDCVVREAKARSELALRDLRGVRRFDA